MRELVPARAADSHKGDFGRVLVIAGSLGRTGAAHLAALGALRSGAGLVTIATPRSCVPIDRRDGAGVHDRAARRDAAGHGRFRGASIGCSISRRTSSRSGPGSGQSPGTRRSCRRCVERAGVPLVLDADALNAFVGEPERLMGRDGVDVIITPHPGEMARLLEHQRSRRCSTIGSSTRASLPPPIASTSCSRGIARSSPARRAARSST